MTNNIFQNGNDTGTQPKNDQIAKQHWPRATELGGETSGENSGCCGLLGKVLNTVNTTCLPHYPMRQEQVTTVEEESGSYNQGDNEGKLTDVCRAHIGLVQ